MCRAYHRSVLMLACVVWVLASSCPGHAQVNSSGTVASQEALLKKKITIKEKIGPLPLQDVFIKLSDEYKITFIIHEDEFDKVGYKDVLNTRVTIGVMKDTELAKVLESFLAPIKAKCVPGKGVLDILPLKTPPNKGDR